MPPYVRELLTYQGCSPPVVLGGVLRRVAGGSHYSREGESCVSLLAAHLPGVRLAPFHATHGSLPGLGGAAAWADLVRAARASAAARKPAAAGASATPAAAAASFTAVATAAAGRAAGAAGLGPQAPGAAPEPESVAALLLSTPHFVELEELLGRFGSVAAGMQVIGGVTAPGAWGESESSWGAVWLNDKILAKGAVGCILQGRFKLDTIVSPGFRGAGPVMRVTQAQGPCVLEVDGEPVQKPLQRAISEALTSGELATALKIGVGVAGAGDNPGKAPTPPSDSWGGAPSARPVSAQPPSGASNSGTNRPLLQPVFPSRPAPAAAVQSGQRLHEQPQTQGWAAPEQQLVTRNWHFQQTPPPPVMAVATSEPIARGTALQVHLQNYPAAHTHMRDRLRDYSERLPPRVAATEGGLGVLGLSCSSLPFHEDTDVASCLPNAAFAGGKVEGEICSTLEGQPSRLHSFTSCIALLRPADASSGSESPGGAAHGA